MKEWRRSLKRIFVLVLSVVLIGNSVDLSGLMVSAESAQVQEDVSGGDVLSKEVSGGDVQLMSVAGDNFTLTPVPELPDSEELFAAYVDKTMYGGFSFFGRAAGDTLNVGSKAIYDVLKVGIEDIAAGRVASTLITIDVTTSAAKTVYTAADLGVDSLVVNGAANQEAVNKIGSVFIGQFDFEKVIEALLHDCPYEFYWFDKVTGYGWNMPSYLLNISYDDDLDEYVFSVQGELYFYFLVAKAYQPANYDANNPTVDTAKTSATTTAAAKAAAIVAANASKDDEAKLTAYRDAICDLVTYNHDALNTGTPYGDPWQLVYVFDGNTETNVVCEGYAKAFQYLCDMSDFDAAECYTVSGEMGGGTGAGGHMWNVVTMDDGKNYIVDITNSDDGSVGQSGGLFLNGTAGSIAQGYVFNIYGQNVIYAYYDDTKALWGTGDDSILKLADSKYEKKADPVAKVSVGGTETPYESFADAMAAATDGATVTLLKDVTVEAGTWADDILNVTGNVKLALNGKTLDMGVTGINIGSGNGLEVENGSIKSANSTSAIFVMGSLSLKDVNVSNTTGHYGIFAVTGTEMSIEGGNLEGETAAVSFGGELAIAGSPKFTGGLAGLEIVSNMSSIVVEEAVGAGTTYTLLVNDYGAGKDLISAADGVALKAEWFKDVRGEFVVVQGSTADTLSLLYDFTKATVTVEDATVEYTGSAKAPTLTVAYGDDALTKDTDYTVSYLKGETAVSEMKELGSYTVVITGKGDYAGTVKKSFEIVKAGIASVNVAVTAPAAQAVPQGSIAAGENYTGTISWAPAAAKFGFNTVYKATVVLTADGNHKFTNGTTYAGFDTAVVSADGTTLTLTKSFDATRKEKLTAAETLAPVALDVYCSDVTAVVAKLPAQVTYTTETGTVKLAVDWAVSGTYDATPDAVNTFTWSVAEADKWSSYDANGVADNGTVKVTNAAALAVNNKANNKEITYDGKTFDVSTLFDVDANAGAASFAVVSSSAADAGAATLSGSVLTITKAGKITVKLTTAAKGAYAAGEATAVLTVNKAAGNGTVKVEDITYGGTVNAVITSTTNNSYTVRYTGQGYDSATAPVNAGDYTVTVSFAENDLYKGATASDTFTIKKATPVLTGVKAQNEVLYESTLVSEVVLKADSTSVPGTLVLDGVTELTVGTKDYAYKFTPDDTANYEVVTGKVSLTVLENALVKIEATGMPKKIIYSYGDKFEIAGITVIATYADDSTRDVTSLVSYDKALAVGQTQVTLTYQSKTCTVQGIIVEKKKIDLAAVIWDVEAFETYDGKEKTIVLTDNLPAGVKVSYSGNKAIDAGSYQAKVEFELAEGYSADNYQIVTYPHHSEAYTWMIIPKPIDENNTTCVLGDALIYTGQAQTQTMKSVTADGLNVTFDLTDNVATDAGEYEMTVTAKGNFTGTVKVAFAVAKATPVVSGVKAEGKLFESTAVSSVVLTAESTSVPGTLVLDGVTELTVGTKDYAYRFTPDDLDNYKEVTGTVSLTVLENTLEKIEVSGTPNKTTYTYGEEFVLTGAMVTATYADGASKDVTALVSYDKALVAGQTEVTVTYQGKTCKVSGIVVEKKAITADNVTYTPGEGLVYNGKAQTQTISAVKADGMEVTYDVTGNVATNAGAYELTITGTGNFTGSVKVPYSVAKKNISGAKITLGEALTYNGAEQTKGINSVVVDEINLTASDYVVSGNKATDAGEYTLTVTAAENGNFTGSATAKWSMAKKDISAVAITLGEALTYTGAEQTQEYTVGKADGLTVTYDASGYKATNAGSYELTITGKGNFTGTAKKAWSIAAKSIADAQVVLGNSLTYTGSELSQTIGSVTVSGITLKTTDYEVSGNKVTDAGSYELTITGKGNFTGSATKAYVVAKAKAPAIADVAKNYVYSAGSKDVAESIDVAALLPKNAKVSGYVLSANDAAYVTDEAVSADGKLTYKVGKSGSAGQSTTLTVIISSGNYEDMTVKVAITLTDKKITVLKSGSEVNVNGAKELTYGQKLSELVLDSTKAVFVADGTDTVVEGTLSWAAPDTVLTAGQAAPQWKFVPKDAETYTELTGSMTINVKKAVPTVNAPAVGVSTYHPEKTLADLTLVGNKGSHTVAGTKVDVDGSWSFKDGAKVPTVKNDGYTVVFTPVDTNNYEVVEKVVTVEVAKATPIVDVKPEAAALTYGQTLAEATLTGGKAAYAEGSTITVAGSFAWKDGSVAPTVADSETTEYAVVFTPADADNYNTVALKLTVKVAKALNAPNMPVETLTAAHTVTTVGQISLPVDWSWAEEDADIELTVGVAETATAVYVGADADNYEVVTVEITITKAAAPAKPSVTVPESGKPHIVGANGLNGWDVIREEVTEATTGETVNVDMNGAKEVPGNVFDNIKGKDVTAVFHMDNGLSWTVGGKYITAAKVADLNLGVSTGNTTIPANVLNKVTGGRYSMNITLDYSGEFGLTAILNVNVKAENKGRFANLFYYNPAYGSMQFVCADEISEQGMAHLPFTHASEYVIVIDDTIMNNVFASPKTGDEDMSWSLWWLVALAAFAVSGGYAVNKKKSR